MHLQSQATATRCNLWTRRAELWKQVQNYDQEDLQPICPWMQASSVWLKTQRWTSSHMRYHEDTKYCHMENIHEKRRWKVKWRQTTSVIPMQFINYKKRLKPLYYCGIDINISLGVIVCFMQSISFMWQKKQWSA